MFLLYGKGKVLGHPSQDRACFSPGDKNCLDKLTFLTVFKSADLQALKGSGIVGLSPSPGRPNDGGANANPMEHVPGFI